jgi:hypothetical protein
VNNGDGVVAAQETILWFSLFEHVCEALTDSFMRLFWGFGFQLSFPFLGMTLFNHILIICIVHIFIVLYELKSTYMNGLTVNLDHPNVPASVVLFMDQKRVNSTMFHV